MFHRCRRADGNFSNNTWAFCKLELQHFVAWHEKYQLDSKSTGNMSVKKEEFL